MKKTKEEAEFTKLQIQKVAIKVFIKNGYSATRLEDIASEANVTRGAIYHYFKNKRDILLAIHQNNRERIQKIIDELVYKEKDPIEIIRKGFLQVYEHFENDEDFKDVEELFFKIEFASIIHHDEIIRDCFHNDLKNHKDRIFEIINKGQQEKKIRKDINAENLAIIIMTFHLGLSMLWFKRIMDFPITEMAKNQIEVLLNGIAINK
ncbi:MAG: TetR family transcriptional regulator [Ignavibacteriae bacterium]|nr:TetR family transcriptional regulator [Ignavibacteriota bacterium]